MMIGKTFRLGFERMIQLTGEDLILFKNFGTQSQIEKTVRGMKNCEKGRPNDVMFQFLHDPGIELDDVLQQQGARDQWRVTSVEDEVIAGVYVNFEAKVQKLGTTPAIRSGRPGQGDVHFTVNAPVQGGILFNSPHAQQTNTAVNGSVVTPQIAELKGLFNQSDVDQLEKEEALEALERIEELCKREKTPQILIKIKEKLDLVTSIASSVASLSAQAAPYIAAIWSTIQSIQ